MVYAVMMASLLLIYSVRELTGITCILVQVKVYPFISMLSLAMLVFRGHTVNNSNSSIMFCMHMFSFL